MDDELCVSATRALPAAKAGLTSADLLSRQQLSGLDPILILTWIGWPPCALTYRTGESRWCGNTAS